MKKDYNKDYIWEMYQIQIVNLQRVKYSEKNNNINRMNIHLIYFKFWLNPKILILPKLGINYQISYTINNKLYPNTNKQKSHNS